MLGIGIGISPVFGGQVTTVTPGQITAENGGFSFSGMDASLLYTRIVVAASGGFSFAGQDATLTGGGADPVLTAESGGFVFSGADATTVVFHRLVAEVGGFTFAGQDATLRRTHILVAGNGGFTFAGQDATLQKSGGTAYVTGNRTASITVTQDSGYFHAPMSDLVDGGFGLNDGDSTYFSSAGLAFGNWVKFDFGTGKVVDEAKWYQDTTDTHGTWQWEGSNDDSSYTSIGATFTLGGATPFQTQTTLNGNATSYRYYRLIGVSGNRSSNPWLQEIEFKQN